MNLRWLERNGEKVLQEILAITGPPDPRKEIWKDVPLVTEPRKPREWTLCKNELGWHATAEGVNVPFNSVSYRGGMPNEIVSVREVLDESKAGPIPREFWIYRCDNRAGWYVDSIGNIGPKDCAEKIRMREVLE